MIKFTSLREETVADEDADMDGNDSDDGDYCSGALHRLHLIRKVVFRFA